MDCPRCHAAAGLGCTSVPDCDPGLSPGEPVTPHVARIRALDKAIVGWRGVLRRCIDALETYKTPEGVRGQGFAQGPEGFVQVPEMTEPDLKEK